MAVTDKRRVISKFRLAGEFSGSGPGGYFIGGDFRAAYAPGVTLNGAGQSVGLVELDGYYPSDIAEYEILAKVPNVTLTNVLLDGATGAPGVTGMIEASAPEDVIEPLYGGREFSRNARSSMSE